MRKVRKVLVKSDGAAARLVLTLVDRLGVLERDIVTKQAGDAIRDPRVASKCQECWVVCRHVNPIQRLAAIAAVLQNSSQLLHFLYPQDVVNH